MMQPPLRHRLRTAALSLLPVLMLCSAAAAQPTEDDYYKIVTLPVPEGLILEVGGLATLPDGNIALSTRRGDLFVVENPYMENGTYPNFRRFATGLHEPLGLAYRNGAFYTAQRGELTKIRDTDGDGRADRFENIYSWPITGNYHEYSYGPKFLPDGDLMVTLNLGFWSPDWWAAKSKVPWRGWALKISPDGAVTPWATGMRSPCGIGVIDGEFFYADNQGDWIGSGGLTHVKRGAFMGHPAGLHWAERDDSPVAMTVNDVYYKVSPRLPGPGEPPTQPRNVENEPLYTLADFKRGYPQTQLPAVWLPHTILGISNSEILQDTSSGNFGPFSGQVFVGDQGQSKLMRVFLEEVRGEKQGVAFPFRENFQSGILRMTWGKDGSMFVGQTNRGWGSQGPENQGVQRVVWSGEVPFEMKAVRAMPDGFDIEFTKPVDKATAGNYENYQVTSFTYKYHPVYGSPVVDQQNAPVWGVRVSKDGLRARIVVDSLREKYVHEVRVRNVRDYAEGHELLHDFGYYTLNHLPEGDRLDLPRPKPAVTEAPPAPAHHHQTNPETAEVPSPDAPQPAVARAAPKKAPEKESVPKTSPVPQAKAAPRRASGKRVTRPPSGWGEPDQSIVLATLPGLRYDRSTITVKAGSRVKFSFYNNDDMMHNVVITRPGRADAVARAALALGLDGTKLNYVPNTADVLFHTQIMPPGTNESIYFEVPDQPGSYTYVCTFPGHAQVMRGTLRVVP